MADGIPMLKCPVCPWTNGHPVTDHWTGCAGFGKELTVGLVKEQVQNEVRTVSLTGGEKGVKAQRLALLPSTALNRISEVYHFGASKYSAHNWRKGYEWSKSYDALQRHLSAWWERDEIDPESGLSHLAHAGFHLFALITYSGHDRYKQFDDRYNPEEGF